MTNLDGRVVVITGAGSGIGRSLALLAARRGARLALSDVNEAGLAETAKLCATASVRSDRLDVRDREAVASYAAAVAEHYGVVNVVINNAGIALLGELCETTYDQIERIIDVDFWGVVHGSKEFLPHLIESGDGHLVNISSIFGIIGIPGQTAYNAAKFAVRGFTEALREEMLVAKAPVRVSCVHPGGIKTNIVANADLTSGKSADEWNALFDKRLARTTADQAAKVILDGVAANKPRIMVGLDAKVLDLVVRVLGPAYQRVVASTYARITPKDKVPTSKVVA